MAWSSERSEARINSYITSSPINEIVVEDFGDYYAKRQSFLVEERKTNPLVRTDPILNLSYNRAVLTDGVHIYVNLMDFKSTMFDNGTETEASHKKALEFLHLHYGACDRLVQEFGIQRVDYHGHRLHAVVLTPEGEAGREERALKALAFSEALIRLVGSNNDFYSGRYRTDVRIGIDEGKAVAINSGRGTEPEPLFIGSPANHAAKQAEGIEPGVFLTPRVSFLLSMQNRISKSSELPTVMAAANNLELRTGVTIERMVNDIQKSYLLETGNYAATNTVPAVFHFSKHSIPLKTINYADHPPSKSIRMEMATCFADIVGFTNYIDLAIANNTINEVVANLHVVRRELVACLRDDFGGKKIRFIGDCLHGISAKGDSSNTNGQESVENAILIAGGLRSSFNLLKSILPNMSNLDIAIGIDFGFSPVSRIGKQGLSSVRCSVSHSTSEAESSQSDCGAYETKISENAKKLLPVKTYINIPKNNVFLNLDYSSAEILIEGIIAPTSSSQSEFQAHGN